MISAAVIAAGMLASCSNKEIVDEQPETDGVSASVLNIVPTVGTDTRAGFVPKTEWAVNDAMGLFMYKATGWGDAYPRYDAQNNKSTKTAAGWSQAKPVYLLSDKATIWAYYPYNQAVADGTKVPVPINAGTSVDYMWGKSTNQVSVIETDAVIPMKHALSQLVIRLKVSPEYHNDGNLTSAKTEIQGGQVRNLGDNEPERQRKDHLLPDIHGTLMDSQHDHSGTGEPVGRLRRRNLSHEPGIRRSQHGGRHRRGNLYLFHSPDKLGSRKEIYLFDNDALQ